MGPDGSEKSCIFDILESKKIIFCYRSFASMLGSEDSFHSERRVCCFFFQCEGSFNLSGPKFCHCFRDNVFVDAPAFQTFNEPFNVRNSFKTLKIDS